MVGCQYLSGGAEHAARGTGAWSGRHTHNTPSHLREGDRGRTRFTAWRPFLCHHSDWLSHGKIWADTARPAANDCLQGPLGPDLGGRLTCRAAYRAPILAANGAPKFRPPAIATVAGLGFGWCILGIQHYCRCRKRPCSAQASQRLPFDWWIKLGRVILPIR